MSEGSRPMRDLNRDAFWTLLARLDSDPDEAGQKYEALRHKLVVFFEGRSCGVHSELLADRTLDRVAARLAEAAEIYARASVSSYSYGVARFVWKEWNAEKKPAPLEVDVPAAPGADPIPEVRLNCLEKCLDELAPESRKLILNYYQGEGGQKIRNRTRLAEYFDISLNALRRRAHWIRVKQLEPCLRKCAENGSSH